MDMDREEKVKFLIEAIEEVEGVKLSSTFFKKMSEAELEAEVEWLEYLLTK